MYKRQVHVKGGFLLEVGGDGGFSLDVFKVVKEDEFMSKEVFCWSWVGMEVFQ